MYNMVREEEMSSKKVAARWSKRATLLRNRSLFEQTLNENQMLETQSLDQSNPISQKATKKLPLQNSILDESDLMHRSGVENDQGKKILNLNLLVDCKRFNNFLESMNAEMEADEVIDRENEMTREIASQSLFRSQNLSQISNLDLSVVAGATSTQIESRSQLDQINSGDPSQTKKSSQTPKKKKRKGRKSGLGFG